VITGLQHRLASRSSLDLLWRAVAIAVLALLILVGLPALTGLAG